MRKHVIGYGILVIALLSFVSLCLYQHGKIEALKEMNTELRQDSAELQADAKAMLARATSIADRAGSLARGTREGWNEVLQIPSKTIRRGMLKWAKKQRGSPPETRVVKRKHGKKNVGMGGGP